MSAKSSEDGDTTKKVEVPTGEAEGDKTAILDSAHVEATRPVAASADTVAATTAVGAAPGKSNGNDRTVINRPTDGDSDKAASHSTQRRKLMGWLVSYSIDPQGIDFKLYEGRNTVGRSPESNIKVMQDAQLSSNHATILFRNSQCYVKDEMASNPSLVNDVEIEPGQTVQVTDGDILTFGAHRFLLKSSIG